MEYKGEFTPYSYIPKKGRINPSLFAGAPDSTVPMINYYNDDYTIQPLDQLETWWIGLGVLPNRNISFYCGTGWRSSVAWMCAYAMGWENIKNYDGGWYEWSEKIENNSTDVSQ